MTRRILIELGWLPAAPADFTPQCKRLLDEPLGLGARIAVLARHAGKQPLLAGKAICPTSGACDVGYGATIVDVEVVK